MNQPSQSTANDLLRVLKGEPRKYTAKVHYPDGKMLEFQTDHSPETVWCEQSRALWLKCKCGDSYNATSPIMEWVPGSVLLLEQNPGWKDSK